MKTKKYIIFTLVAFITGVLTVITSSVYASGGSGGSGPGCTSCECYGTCDDPTTSGTYPPTSGTYPPTSGTYPPTSGTYPPTSGTRYLPPTSGTYTTNIIIVDPPITTSGTNLTNDMVATCLPKKFTKLPEKTDVVSLSGLCGGGVFIYTQSYTITVGNKIQTSFEGLCTNSITTKTCTYTVDNATCLNDTFTCPDGTKLTRTGDQCAFPSCKKDPKCQSETYTCPDGTVLNSFESNGKCVFPSCPENKQCPTDTYTCPNGDVLKRSGDACVFPACTDLKCEDKDYRCSDGTILKQVKINEVCAFPSCPATNDSYHIAGVVKVDDQILEGVTVQIYKIDDTNFSNPLKGSQTSSDGSYIISGLTPGEYIVKPLTNENYAFLSVQSVKIQKSNIKDRNFNGLAVKKVTNPIITNIIKESVVTGGDTTNTTTSGSLTSWLDELTGNGNKTNISTSGTTNKTENTGTVTGTGTGTGTSSVSGAGTGSGGTSDSGSDSSLAGELSNAMSKAYTDVFTFTGNSLISILEKGYTLENQSYSPVALSLISRYANQNSICGNGKTEEGETCDDGKDNGKRGFCSPDCLYRGEIRFSDEGIQSNAIAYKRSNGSGVIQKIGQWSSSAAQKISTFKVLSKNIVGDSYNKISRLSADTVAITKDIIISHTSPRTRKVLKQVAVVTQEVAKYSVVGVASLLGVAAVSLNVMVFKSQWKSYTIQEGDTFDNIGSKFNMTERAIRRRNGIDKKKALRPGMKIKVRNRAFIEKDYLNQLQSVLTDALKTGNHGSTGENIANYLRSLQKNKK